MLFKDSCTYVQKNLSMEMLALCRYWRISCDGLASHSAGVAILLHVSLHVTLAKEPEFNTGLLSH